MAMCPPLMASVVVVACQRANSLRSLVARWVPPAPAMMTERNRP